MKSLYDFIVEPLGERYANTKKIGEKKLILNTKIESWKFVNRFALVLETPLAMFLEDFTICKVNKATVDLILKTTCIL